MLWQSTSAPLSAEVRRAGMANNAGALGALLREAEQWKPSGYDKEIAKRRDYYRGHHSPHLLSKLAERYPQTYHKMSAYPVPLFRHLVERQATIYRANPRREILVDGSASDELSQRAARLYERALADNRLQRIEQVAAAAKTAFVRVATDVEAERLLIDARWPDSVFVVPDPDWPCDLQRARALVAEIAGAGGVRSASIGNKRYEVWQRGPGGWEYAVSTGDGSQWATDGRRWEFLPWVAVFFEEPSALYELPPADDLAVVDAIGCMYTSLNYTIDMQSHAQLWYAGPTPEQKLVGGPGSVWMAGESGTFGAINYQPQIASVKEAADNLIGRWLALHNLAPGSASAEPSYESGVALKVKSQPMLEARLSRIPLYREIEERWLWPIMRELGSTLDGEEWPDGAELKWTPGDLQLPLDDEAEFRLAEQRVAARVSTWPEEMVRLRLAPDIATAEEKYTANKRAAADRAREFQRDMAQAGGPQQPPQQMPPQPMQDEDA